MHRSKHRVCSAKINNHPHVKSPRHPLFEALVPLKVEVRSLRNLRNLRLRETSRDCVVLLGHSSRSLSGSSPSLESPFQDKLHPEWRCRA